MSVFHSLLLRIDRAIQRLLHLRLPQTIAHRPKIRQGFSLRLLAACSLRVCRKRERKELIPASAAATFQSQGFTR
jgi:hypothetical protein